jgi:hypothetical protein
VITEAKARILYTANSARDAVVSQKDNQVTIKKGRSRGKYKIVEVTATIENKGKLATHLARGSGLAGNREDVVWLIGNRDRVTYLQGSPFQRLGVIEGTMKIPGYTRRAAPRAQRTQMQRMSPFMPPGRPMFRRQPRFRPTQVEQTGPKRTVTWLVAVNGDSPLKIVVASQKGGTKMKRLSIQ